MWIKTQLKIQFVICPTNYNKRFSFKHFFDRFLKYLCFLNNFINACRHVVSNKLYRKGCDHKCQVCWAGSDVGLWKREALHVPSPAVWPDGLSVLLHMLSLKILSNVSFLIELCTLCLAFLYTHIICDII